MSKEITPTQFATFLRAIAVGIDKSKKPRADLVASDIRCAIAAANGDEGAIKRVREVIAAHEGQPSTVASDQPESIVLKFKGEPTPENLARAASEIVSRRPNLDGKKLSFRIQASVED